MVWQAEVLAKLSGGWLEVREERLAVGDVHHCQSRSIQ